MAGTRISHERDLGPRIHAPEDSGHVRAARGDLRSAVYGRLLVSGSARDPGGARARPSDLNFGASRAWACDPRFCLGRHLQLFGTRGRGPASGGSGREGPQELGAARNGGGCQIRGQGRRAWGWLPGGAGGRALLSARRAREPAWCSLGSRTGFRGAGLAGV